MITASKADSALAAKTPTFASAKRASADPKLSSVINNETVNLNQTRDDIFNIYMNGYINSKNILFTNYKAIKGT